MLRLILLSLCILLSTNRGFASTIVNDGNINWNGNWQQTYTVKALHASTNLNVDSGTSQVSAAWNGDGARDDLGVLVYLNSVTTPATARTITVALEEDDNDDGNWADAVTRASTTITLNSDSKTGTWYYLKYGSAFSNEEAGTANYRIKLTSDNAADTGFRADKASTTNIAIIQVLTATEAADTTDVVYVCGYATAATGNPTAAAVTYNVETGAGTGGDDGQPMDVISICNAGTLAFSTTASKNYYLEINADMTIYNGGEFDIGAGTAIPTTSTATLELNGASTRVDIYVNAGGKFRVNGGTKFSTATNFRCTSTDAIVATNDRTVSTSIDVSTLGWAAGDEISISSTSAANGTEKKTIDSVGSSTITITTDWTSTHLAGAEICNLTRNILVKGVGTNTGRIYNASTSGGLDFDWARFEKLDDAGSGSCPIENTNGALVDIDNCVFVDLNPGGDDGSIDINVSSPLTFTNLVLYDCPNGFEVSTSCRYLTIQNASFMLSSVRGFYNRSTLMTIVLENVNMYDSPRSSSSYATYTSNGGVTIMKGCKFWLNNNNGTDTVGAIYIVGSGEAYLYNCILGGDGTNTVANSFADISLDQYSKYHLYNTKLLSTTEVETSYIKSSPYNLAPIVLYASSHDHDGTQYRYKTWQVYGTLTDNTTTTMTGEAGTCLVMSSSSSTAGNTLNWEFWIPVTAATDPQLKFYVKKSNDNGGSPTLNIDVYDSDDDATLLENNTAISLTTSWAQYSVSLDANPTDTGYCRVVLKTLDDATNSEDIGIDTLSYVLDGATYTVDFERWKDALPEMAGEGEGAATGGSTMSYGYSN